MPLLHDIWGLNREDMKARAWNHLKALSLICLGVDTGYQQELLLGLLAVTPTCGLPMELLRLLHSMVKRFQK